MMKELLLQSGNLRRLAAMNGFESVGALAEFIGRHRVSLYNALHRPEANGPTLAALNKALPKRSFPDHRKLLGNKRKRGAA